MEYIKRQVQCPYCGHRFKIPKPPNQPDEPRQIKCVPYTRDVGRFDPNSESEWFSPNGWSRIGADYLKWLNWERIGVLRVLSPKVRVLYRVQGCPNCSHLFDVYANYTDGYLFENLWPHLFAQDIKNNNAIKLYFGESWIIWIIRRLGSLFRSMYVGGLMFGIIVFSMWLFLHWMISGSIGGGGELLLFGVASVIIIFLLIIKEKYVSYFEKTKDFFDLFVIEKPEFGLVHWRNYVICRFVGVQVNKLPSLTQVDIISGGVSVLLLIISWLYSNFLNLAGLAWLAFVLLVTFIAFVAGRKIMERFKSCLPQILLFLGFTVGLMFLLLFSALLIGVDHNFFVSLVNLVFWILFAYLFGVSGLISLNTSYYVLDGLTRIPMKLTTYNNFRQVKPLRVLESFSIGLLLVLFVGALSIIYLSLSIQFDWIIYWLRLVLVFLFVATGFAINRGEYFAVAILYFLLSFLPDLKLVFTNVSLDLRLLILGLLFSLVVGFQILRTDGTVSRLLLATKTDELNDLDAQLKRLNNRVSDIDNQLSMHTRSISEENELYSQRKSILESMEALLRLRDRVDKVSVSPIQPRRVLDFLSPLFSSVVLPIILDVAVKYLTKTLGII